MSGSASPSPSIAMSGRAAPDMDPEPNPALSHIKASASTASSISGHTPSKRSGPPSDCTSVAVSYDEPDTFHTHPRINFRVAECIETKTITTTTTTKRSYPPYAMKGARPLSSLDSKEYPLAHQATPPSLANFTFSVERDSEAAYWPAGERARDPNHSSTSAVEHDNTPMFGEEFPDGSKQHSISTEIPSRPAPLKNKRTSLRDDQDISRPTKQKNVSPEPTPVRRSTPRHSTRSQNREYLSHGVPDRLRRSLAHSTRRDVAQDRDPSSHPHQSTSSTAASAFPVTPDTSEVAPVISTQQTRPPRTRRSNLDSFETADSEIPESQQSFFEISSPSGSDTHNAFSTGSVATPPITDNDTEPFTDADESLQQSIRALHHPRPVNTVAAQDASLPSPRLSPTLQATQLHSGDDDPDMDSNQGGACPEDSQLTIGSFDGALQESWPSRALQPRDPSLYPGLMDSHSMLESFDSMPSEMKSFMMYQFLRRCSRKTLHVVADVVNPALKCDILKDLPLELALHVVSFLGAADLCRGAQVSKYWRTVIDCNETGWKELFDADGYVLAPGELEKAIREGWGWQDPVGPEGSELDFSLQSRMSSTESDLFRSTQAKVETPAPKLRSSKRKRTLNSLMPERAKRRASAQDNVKDIKTMLPADTLHKAEGPISAANAAVLAVSNPHLGFLNLRQMHLYKSLYRRHCLIRRSWTSGKVKPSHVAFAAHPRHVITCLQFDEDKIITGSDDMLIHVYDTKTGKLRKRLEGHEGGVWALQYEGNTLVSGSTDRSVRVWDIEKGLNTQVFYGHTSTVRCLQILMPTDTGRVENGVPVMMPPKPLIITGSRDSQLRVWRLPESSSRRYIQTGPPANDADCPFFIRTLHGHTHSVRAIAAHADTLVSGSYDNTVRVWKISTGETVHTLQGHAQKVYSVVLDTARNRCISGSMDSFVKIWDLETGACTHTLEGHNMLVGLLDLRDERLVSAAADSTLRIWDPLSGRCQHTLTAHTGAITCFQHDGRKVISGSDRTLKMWDIKTGECITDLLTDLGGVWQVRFDERRCVAAVQRDSLTYIEILDFGAVRDGKSPEELGKRILLNPGEVQRIMEENEE